MPTTINMGSMGRHLSRIGPQLINVLKGNVALSGDLLALGKKLYPLFFGVAGLSPDDPFPIQLVFDQNRDRNIFPYPYELIADDSGAQICRQQGAMIRVLDKEIAPRLLTLPLRVLLIIASPQTGGYDHLNTEIHQQAIRHEWAYFDKLVYFDTITGPNTLEKLRQKLTTSNPYHIVHIVAHGSDNFNGGGGAIIFADENGGANPLDGNHLYAELTTLTGQTPHLVILNSCLTGGGQKVEANQFAVVTWQLLVSGIPAVVAMQAKVLEENAAAAAARFYHLLLAGHSLDKAVLGMRTSLVYQWYAPILALQKGYDCHFFTPETRTYLHTLHEFNEQVKSLYTEWQQNKTPQQYQALRECLRRDNPDILPLIHNHDELAEAILYQMAEKLNVLM